MKTIKAILVSIAVLVGVNTYAQDKALTFGVKGGVNLSTLTGDVENQKAKVGFNAGVTLDYALTESVYLLSGLEYNLKGAKWSEGDYSSTLNLGYIQLPIHAGYKLDVADATKIVFHAGPYVAYGVNGKWSDEYEGEKESGDAFGDEGGLKRFDFGVGLGVGAEFGKIGVGLGYDFGLANINDDSDEKVRNANAYLTVGYKF